MMKGKIILGIVLALATVLLAANALEDLSSAQAITVSLVNQDPDPAIAGDVFEVKLGSRDSEMDDNVQSIHPGR